MKRAYIVDVDETTLTFEDLSWWQLPFRRWWWRGLWARLFRRPKEADDVRWLRAGDVIEKLEEGHDR